MDQNTIVISAIGTPQLHDGTGHGGVGEATGTAAGKVVTIETPEGQKDVRVNLIRPSIAILVRAIWLFATTLSGALGAGATGAIAMDFKTALIVAGSAAALGALKDAGTVLNSLKDKYPLLTGGI